MNRRAFITGLGAVLDGSLAESFRRGLREVGYTEGRDIVIVGRRAEHRIVTSLAGWKRYGTDAALVGTGTQAT